MKYPFVIALLILFFA